MQTAYQFEVRDGCVCKVDSRTGRAVARRAPVGTSVVQALVVGSRLIVREDYYGYPPGQSNVYCLTDDFGLVWFAELPTRNDAFANPLILDSEGRLSSASWGGITCSIDIETGCIITALLTK
jgi:hypothetical protein